jgi:N-acetylneuraminic acid mutarotase
MWVIGGFSPGIGTVSDVWNTDDGITWNQVTSSAEFPGRASFSSSVFENRIWITAGSGNKNDVWYSFNGEQWELATSSANFVGRFYHTSVTFNNRLWVIGGHKDFGSLNDVWYLE